ncbi:MAG: BamA/TamA family outer membrane protein [Salinivenus sp.]
MSKRRGCCSGGLVGLGLLLMLTLCAPSTHAQSADTTGTDAADWLVLPYASYSPTTEIAVGLVVGYYRAPRPGGRASSVATTFTATQRRQLIAEVEPELYLRSGQWRVEGQLLASDYPDVFYGVGGDTPASAETAYTARYGTIDLSAQRRVRSQLRVGPRLFVRTGTVRNVDDGTPLARGHVPGADGGTTLGVGASALWDARSRRYDPRRGTYAEASLLLHSAAWGSDHTFGRLTTDGRAYRSLGPGTGAVQVYTEAVAGTAPFQLLPLLGGSDRMRGFREGRYRDTVYGTVQAEYRVPLFWRFKAAAFASVGAVGPRVGTALVENAVAAAGVGGWLRLTDDGVHGRLDLAYSKSGIEVYMSLGEAF